MTKPDFIAHFDEQFIIEKLTDDDFPIYTNITNVTPTIEEQTLSTANTLLLSDITVSKIPISDVSNSSGGVTITIG